MATSKNKQPLDKDIDLTAYESLNFAGTERHANYRVIAYREDVLHILEKKDAAAIIYQIIYRWLTEKRREDILAEMDARKKAGQPQLTPQEVENRMWVYMSYNEFVRESGGAIGYNTVIRTLDYLLGVKIIERRENSNPKFTEYEYRINKETARKLLKELPTFPHYVAKGAKGKEAPLTPTQMGTTNNENPYPGGGGSHTQVGAGGFQKGMGDTQVESGAYPSGGTSQVAAQDSSQDSPQGNTQKQQFASDDQQQKAAASGAISLESLSQKEIELILAYRQQAIGSASTLLEKLPPADEPAVQAQQFEKSTATNEERQVVAASDGALTDEIIVQAFEQFRGEDYTPRQRAKELAAANAVLRLKLPVALSAALLERVYCTYNDDWFREKFGSMEVHHLPDTEQSSGQIRLVRWVKRMLMQDERAAKTAVEEEHKTPVTSDLVEWQGRMMSSEEAHALGYQGGFEQFKRSDNPDDDLAALAARYQSEGLLIGGGRNE
jgi:hypothetical protein